MKRYFLVSLLLTMFAAAFACDIQRIDRYYIYYLPDNGPDWSSRKYEEMAKEWTRLLGKTITADDMFNLPYDHDSFGPDSYSALAKYCSDGRHKEEEQYLHLLVDIQKETNFSYNDWHYPTKEEIDTHNKNLRSILARIRSYKGSRLARQYRLQEMRLAFALKDWDECERIWKKAPKDDSIFTDLMRNLYAGVLYRTDRKDEAFEIYSEMGDTESASWCAAKTGSVAGIRQFYDRDPNSKVLPFLIRQFCNNTQETLDILNDGEDGYDLDWLDVIGAREINRAEADKFVALARDAAANPKVSDKARWIGAAALVKFYYGDYREAAKLLSEAQKAPSTADSRLANEYIAVFVDLANAAPTKYNDMGADKVLWLMANRSNIHSYRMLHRLVSTVFPETLGTDSTLMQLLAATAAQEICIPDWNPSQKYSNDYTSDYFKMLDTIPVTRLKEWAAVNASGSLGKWSDVIRQLNTDPNYLTDIIGTRLLREGRWAKARPYLAKVPLSLLSRQSISPFAATRNFRSLPWASPREKVKDEWEPRKVTRNAKLDFCDYVMNLENNQRTREDAIRLAAAYANAAYNGKCWWLTKYSQSVYDTLQPDARNLRKEAKELLKKAYTLRGKTLPVQIEFAETFLSDQPLTTYDYHTDKDMYNKNSDYFHNFVNLRRNLSGMPRSSWPNEIRRCDVFRQFLKDNPAQ